MNSSLPIGPRDRPAAGSARASSRGRTPPDGARTACLPRRGRARSAPPAPASRRCRGSGCCGTRGRGGRPARRRWTVGAGTRRRDRSRSAPPTGPGRSSRRRGPRGDRNGGGRPGTPDIVGFVAAVTSIQLKTEIPGPRSREILARLEAVVSSALSVYLPVVASEGDGATLTDVDGNTFIDFTGGVGCLNVGHAHPHVVEAVQEQAAKFFHTDFTIVPYEVYVTLAERLIETVPIAGQVKAAFFNAGTEALENAIKFSRAYTKRPAVIAFEGGFHGRTLLSLSMTSKTRPYKAGFGPFAPEVYRLPFAQDYRGPSAREALDALERALVTTVAAETVAAIVIEPVQGEGGFVVAPQEFLTGVRRVCDEHGIVMVVDEVQTGFGRTGKLFAIEHYGIEPDLITVAKSIAAGLPLSG